MAHIAYQTFPWQGGASRSAEKLVSLNLPNLKGKSVLDVGCNAGFFCGYALWAGARSVVGVDANREFINDARKFFPKGKFYCRDWNNLGQDKYDLIFFISSIHYAADQEAMLASLVGKLAPNGVLVLEIGVAPGAENKFVEVERSIDKRLFPTMPKLREMLAPYAVKMIGQGVAQLGDPVPRYVVHVRKRLPEAILLLDVFYCGKSSVAERLFRPDIPIISGDSLYYQIMYNQLAAPDEIVTIIKATAKGNGTLDCGKVTARICAAGLLEKLCEIILERAAGKPFILDMAMTGQYRPVVRQFFDRNFFFVVNVSLEDNQGRLHDEMLNQDGLCQGYIDHLKHNFLIDEDAYLAANPDVARAVASGEIPDAQYHYWNFGRFEKRPLKPAKRGPEGTGNEQSSQNSAKIPPG